MPSTASPRAPAWCSRQALAGELMIQVYVTVAVRWLIPRLHRFQAAPPGHPGAHEHQSARLGIRSGDAAISASSARRTRTGRTSTTPISSTPGCSPSAARPWRRAARGLRQPAELVNHTLLQLYTAEDDWHAWLEAAGVPQLAGRAAAPFRQLSPGAGGGHRGPGHRHGAAFHGRLRPRRPAG